jgi:tRNA (mo5U34)-methyltransferase
MTRDQIIAEVKLLEPWFHYIDLGNGLATKSRSAIGEPVEHPRPTWEKVKACLPEDLSGQTVLDVGCNAGFYSIEMKRRGAARVLGIDSQRDLIRQAVLVRKVTRLDIDYQRMSVYDLDPHDLGQFDITLALGLIYHCKHLVLALEKLFLVTRRLLVLETAIYPPEKSPESFAYPMGGGQPTLHPLAYIENPPDAKEAIYNWFLPGTAALSALLKNIGFDEVKVFPGVQSDRAVLACRKLQPYPDSRMISYLSARLILTKGPSSRSHSGEALRFRVLAENTGYARWLRGSDSGAAKGDVHLVAHLLGKDGEPISWYHAGAFLPHDVAPGEAVEVEITLSAPDTPGVYVLEFDMVSEHLAWFEDLGSVVLKHDLIVE